MSIARVAEPKRSVPVHPRFAPLLGLIGNTPMVELRFAAEGVTVLAKCEFLNPSGSIKDRFAVCVVADAESRGLLKRDSIIVECSSGNTGISLAMIGAAMGYRVRILMSESASVERRHLIRQLGAELILFVADRGYLTGIELCDEMVARDSRCFCPRQFENPLNARDHQENTGLEILSQTCGEIDAFVAGYGTGGTLSGVGRALRASNTAIKIYAMEPAESAMLNGEMPCCHAIDGVAGGFVPPLVRSAPIDGIVKVKSTDAVAMSRRLATEFGLLVGVSSGANVAAALQIARERGGCRRIATILCDRAERYYSTKLFAS
jgi:cysteine synthase A